MPAHDADIFQPTVASASALHRPRLQVRRLPNCPRLPRVPPTAVCIAFVCKG